MNALASVARIIDRANDTVGRYIAWLALFMVLVQFVVVVMRYVFGLGSTVMQESIVYMHATLFLVVSSYTLLHRGHVRCDIFYAAASPKRKAVIDFFGVFVFLLPMCVMIGWVSWPYVAKSWAVFEGSPEGSLGIPGVYLLKTTILMFAALVSLQGLSLAARAWQVLRGRESVESSREDR